QAKRGLARKHRYRSLTNINLRAHRTRDLVEGHSVGCKPDVECSRIRWTPINLNPQPRHEDRVKILYLIRPNLQLEQARLTSHPRVLTRWVRHVVGPIRRAMSCEVRDRNLSGSSAG